jgi:hypothetical protein
MDIGDRQIVKGSGEKLVPIDDAALSLADTLESPNMVATARPGTGWTSLDVRVS